MNIIHRGDQLRSLDGGSGIARTWVCFSVWLWNVCACLKGDCQSALGGDNGVGDQQPISVRIGVEGSKVLKLDVTLAIIWIRSELF
jgi:hypothetical protein